MTMQCDISRRRRLALATALALAAGALPSAQAIDAKYRAKLERSGCTQMTELQGCDPNKTRAENAQAGFAVPAAEPASPYTGTWRAVGPKGETLATIEIDARERVKVNGKAVAAQRKDGGLMFRHGSRVFMIQGDRRLQGEDYWVDGRAKTRGLIQSL